MNLYNNINSSDQDNYYKYKSSVITDMDIILDIYTSYMEPRSKDNRTIFGKTDSSLSYNYDDRILEWDYNKARESYDKAASVARPKTARFYQEMLKNFHDKEVQLKHIMAGCNRSNGFPYLVFGYIIND